MPDVPDGPIDAAIRPTECREANPCQGTASEDETVTEVRRHTLPEHDFVSHEHDEVRRGLDRIHDVASSLDTNDEISAAALGVLHWVDAVLDPHARWEDAWLYPEIDERAGSPWATKLMAFEHQQIRDAAIALASARTTLRQARTPAALIEVRARLFGLEAILRAHITREERFLIPLLASDETREAVSLPRRHQPVTAT